VVPDVRPWPVEHQQAQQQLEEYQLHLPRDEVQHHLDPEEESPPPQQLLEDEDVDQHLLPVVALDEEHQPDEERLSHRHRRLPKRRKLRRMNPPCL